MPCLAQSRDEAARSLTVEVFSPHKVASVTLTPLGQNETVKLCGGCRAKAVRKPLTATVRGDAVELGSGGRANEVELAGAFRVEPDGGVKAIAAAGVWTLRVVHGELRVLLSMDSERYVALALRGEAGAREPIESLKAMAIAVRTFALENADRHKADGFDLCDSTHCQALKFGTPSAQVEQAVRETTGETLWSGARRALVFYTQNCGGRSEDASQAWPGTRAPYLKAHADPYCTRHGTAEWHAEIALADVARVAQSAGWKLPQRIDAVRVLKRTDEGRVLRLEFSGDGSGAPVTASSLRFALNRALGWNQLRSDWYTVTLRNGILSFDGRGYGHGVGLCQAGATEMAAEGRSAAEILNFYFPATRVGVTAEGGAWRSTREAGWTLWSAGSSPALVRDGNAAWAKARSLYPLHAASSGQQALDPDVWAMSTTELFRQATSEPGWMLASTQGTRVFLQPSAVMEQDGHEENTLLHEFLHVLVESESSAQTPLWLREGIVEALAGGSSQQEGVGAGVRVTDLEAWLARPASEAESQRAHAEAARLAGALIARDGLEQVRTWVRSGGVPAGAIRTLALVPAGERALGREPERTASRQR
jgi:stage II sporulation protein D